MRTITVALVGSMLACASGDPPAPAPAPSSAPVAAAPTAPASGTPDAPTGRGHKAKAGGAAAGGAGAPQCCELGMGANGLPGIDTPMYELVDAPTCQSKGGKWVTSQESCETVCCAVGSGGDGPPELMRIAHGSCKFAYMGWVGQVRPTEDCP